MDQGDATNRRTHIVEIERLHAQAQRAAALERRNAVASDLHDSVMQTLFSLHLAAEAALDNWERAPAQAHAALRIAMGLIGATTREMRTLLFELRDGALESEGLARALETYVDLVRRHSDLQIELRIACELDLPAPYRVNLYHLVQEGLMNVVKHARARHASITLAADRGAVRLRLEDDGIGLARTDPALESGGLLLLRERVSELGGTLLLGSRPQGGAYLDAALPVREEPS